MVRRADGLMEFFDFCSRTEGIWFKLVLAKTLLTFRDLIAAVANLTSKHFEIKDSDQIKVV